jgi:hypothetical protein
MYNQLNIPLEVYKACTTNSLQGTYLLEDPYNWFQPYEDEINYNEINQEFDKKTTDSHGLLVGSIRICNTGCEGYHIYVFKGPDSGSVWSDQRIPCGYLKKIHKSFRTYLWRIKLFRKAHLFIPFWR